MLNKIQYVIIEGRGVKGMRARRITGTIEDNGRPLTVIFQIVISSKLKNFSIRVSEN